jgi:hypothetical protein
VSRVLLAACALMLAACNIGSSTTERPALDYPPIGPDGTFWSAVSASREGNAQAFLHLVSPGFIHRAFMNTALPEPESQAEFDGLREQVNSRLLAGATRNSVVLDVEVNRLAEGYMARLRELTRDRFIEVAQPVYGDGIRFRDQFDRAYGPNLVWLDVKVYTRQRTAPDFEPPSIRVRFIQDGFRWLIDDLEPDDLQGSFTWRN